MTVTFKKAGEAVASRVVQSAKTSAKAAAASVHPTAEVKPLRAVNKSEAPHMIPARESSKTTMMPWKGWINRFMKDKLDDDKYNLIKNTLHFWPEDPHNLNQMPPPDAKTKFSNDGQEAGFREVSPGEHDAVDVPLHDLDDDPYDSGYFKRDTRRRYIDPEFSHFDVEKLKLDIQDANDPEVQEAKAKLAGGPTSAPGNKNRFATGPSDYDPSGLRSVMAVTHAAMQEELDKHMPDHVSTTNTLNDYAWLYDSSR